MIDFTENGSSEQGNPLFEANPGGVPCNVLAMLAKIDAGCLMMDSDVHTTLALVHTLPDGDREFSFYRNPGADMVLEADEVPVEPLENTRLYGRGKLDQEQIRSVAAYWGMC